MKACRLEDKWAIVQISMKIRCIIVDSYVAESHDTFKRMLRINANLYILECLKYTRPSYSLN
jgi:hypothetical protein